MASPITQQAARAPGRPPGAPRRARAADGSALFYVTVDEAWRPCKVWRHPALNLRVTAESPKVMGMSAIAASITPMAAALAYAGAALTAAWGVAHAIPTRQVVAGFGPITADNRRIIIQEWLAEAFTMWGTAAVIIAATAAAGTAADVRAWVYRAAAALLVGLGTLTALTGARTAVIWFKICPAVLGTAALLLIIASVL